MLTKVRVHPLYGEVKAITEGGEHKLLVLGAPFGSPEDLDWDGQFFSAKTDFMLDVGETRPVLYMHGRGPEGKPLQSPEVVGKATVLKKDEKGLWFEVILDVTKALGKRLWEKALKGLVRASTGCVAHLFREGAKGEILKWNIGELSLLDLGHNRKPANDNAIAVALKSVYEDADLKFPEEYGEGSEELVPDSVEPEAESEPEVTVAEYAATVLAWHDSMARLLAMAESAAPEPAPEPEAPKPETEEEL